MPGGRDLIHPGFDDILNLDGEIQLLTNLPSNAFLRHFTNLKLAAGQFPLVTLVHEEWNLAAELNNELHRDWQLILEVSGVSFDKIGWTIHPLHSTLLCDRSRATQEWRLCHPTT